ncbi:TCRGL protein, partial [Pomatostomus ruficeps]|nr:TCRGL protein [Pomatostomus ruficeps]
SIIYPNPSALPSSLLSLCPTGGCQNSLKAVGGTQSLALVSLEPEAPQGPPGPSLQPCHLLTLSPVKIPLLASPFPGSASRLDSAVGPLVPAQVTRVTAVSAPAVTLMATNLMEQARADRGKEPSRAACPPTLILRTERKSVPAGSDSDKDHSFKLVGEAGSASNGNKPVASTPVPGSPWCVVWTGDDRVFFFNPTMQLSVWERPLDLRHRGDIKRLLEDPPHKRKLEAAATDKCVSSCPGDENDDLSIKTKRNKTEDYGAAGPAGAREEEEGGEEGSAAGVTPPLEERITHFRDMLLERGVSAFSTWEKELHKVVFDPRYLLLNPEERKQIFEQFVKTRIREEYKEKKNKLLLAKEEFKKLLEESKLSPRTTFKEFAEKHGRDQRFRLVQKKKDQEHFFNQFILILKKRDKENRIRLRKMR